VDIHRSSTHIGTFGKRILASRDLCDGSLKQ
jgi:hypothetical protein